MKRNLHSPCDTNRRYEILAEVHAEIAALRLSYRLEWDREGGFWISVETPDDAARAWVGEDVAYAVRCYERIRGGYVTPCTLEEIVEDLVPTA